MADRMDLVEVPGLMKRSNAKGVYMRGDVFSDTFCDPWYNLGFCVQAGDSTYPSST